MPRILVVDDDAVIAELILRTLVADGHDVLVAPTGEAALAAVPLQLPDLVILDLGLPGIGGIEVCRRLRTTSRVPILFLSAQGDESHKVTALDAGGDDYVTKPVGLVELTARVRALLRRTAQPAQPDVYEVDGLRLDVSARRVTVEGAEVRLTPREFELLQALMEARGATLKRQDLLDRLWGVDWFGDDNVLDVFVRQLRAKIEPDRANPRYVETVRGVGYRLRIAR